MGTSRCCTGTTCTVGTGGAGGACLRQAPRTRTGTRTVRDTLLMRCSPVRPMNRCAGSAGLGRAHRFRPPANETPYDLALCKQASGRSVESRAGHACLDPGLEGIDESLVRQRGTRSPATWGPGPEHHRIRLRVLDELLAGVAPAVAGGVLDLLADLRARSPFPQHGKRRKRPAGRAGHDAARARVRGLVTGLAGLGRCSVAVRSADHERAM